MTPAQRRLFWSRVGDIAAQVPLVINGEPHMADKESWRWVLCAGFSGEQRIADGINGEKVVLGLRLRDLMRDATDEAAKRIAADLITMVEAFGASHGVKWTLDSDGNDYRAAQYEQEARG